MRRNLLAVLVAVGVLGGPNVSVARAEVAVAPASDRFPLPKDAVHQRQDTKAKKSTESRLSIYEVPRSFDAVVAEVRAALKTGKWEVVSDQPSPSGSATRMTVKKNAKTWTVRFTGDDKQAVIIVTAPAA